MKNALIGGVILGASLLLAGNGQAASANTVAQEAAATPRVVEVKADPVANNAYVEANDLFTVAGLRKDKLIEDYRLVKYDVISMNILGFPNGLGYSMNGGGGISASTNVNDMQIGPDGCVVVPYVGRVKLVGMTTDEARDELVARLSKYVKIPSMSLAVKSYAPQQVYVMGEVANPGIKNLSIDNLNSYAALSSAGGVTRHGRSTRVQVIRVVGGTMYYRQLNIKNFVKKHDLTQNVNIQDGDIIYVPKSNGIHLDEFLPYATAWALVHNLTD